MGSYAERLCRHLAAYKEEQLGVADQGVWSRGGRPRPHILPHPFEWLNIVSPIRSEVRDYVQTSGIRLHRDFHHLNSSQAFALNVFYPLLSGTPSDQAAALSALGCEGETLTSWGFEQVPDPAEGTNVDVLLAFEKGRRTAIEVKLSESGFGGTMKDPQHRSKRSLIYEQRLTDKVGSQALSDDVFFANYQLLRNIALADPRAGLATIFFVPFANAKLQSHAQTFLSEHVADAMRASVRLVDAEYFLRAVLKTDTISQTARLALTEVAAKYVIPPAA